MQIYSQELELRCIKTLTCKEIPEKVRSTLLGKLSKDFFHFDPTKSAFERINTIARKRFTVVDFHDLVDDPALLEDYRDLLRSSDAEECRSRKAIVSMLHSMENFRKLRTLYYMSDRILDAIEKGAVDIDKLLDDATNSIAKARKDLDNEDRFVIVGKNGNADDVVHRVLNKLSTELIKTGFAKYDSINGGVPIEGVMLLASTTSGGKSTLLMNLLCNMYEREHKRVCRVSLEMGDDQEMARLLSRVSGVPFSKIKQNKMSPKEKQRVEKAYRDFDAIGKEYNCVFNTVSPTKNMTIDDVLRMVKPFRFDVIGIDYVSLLSEGSGKRDQWQVLNDIIKDCKVFSRENKCLVIVLCQLDDESDRLRYAKGMKDHADVMWSWNYSKKEQREMRVLPVNTNKARDGELLNFDLAERFDIMTITDLDSDSYTVSDDDEDERPRNSSKKNVEEEEYGDDDYALS